MLHTTDSDSPHKPDDSTDNCGVVDNSGRGKEDPALASGAFAEDD